MTRREGAIVAFAVATLLLAVAIAFGHAPSRPTSDGHLPVLNGPSPAPSLTGSTPGGQPSRANVAMGRFGAGEDEAEDEPASAEAASSRSTGSPLPVPLP